MREFQVATGCYDEHVRLWDLRNATIPVMSQKVCCFEVDVPASVLPADAGATASFTLACVYLGAFVAVDVLAFMPEPWTLYVYIDTHTLHIL